MATSWRRLWHRLTPQPSPAAEAGVRPEPLSFAEQVIAARAEWHAARLYFENVSDPELVDHAIAVMHATEKKYMYLVNRARQEGISLPTAEMPASS